MTFGVFRDLSPAFYASAGHKYLVSTEEAWMVNVTMEEQFYFTQLD